MKRISGEVSGALLLFGALILGAAGGLAGLEMSALAHLAETYLLPLFFVQVGIELRDEFTRGHFTRRRNLIPPALAALFGVAGPAVIYICIAGKDGWAVPTATDITLGLAAITLFARKFGLRAKFLALATIDDLLGLLILLIFFSAHISVAFLALTFLALLGLAFSQRFSYRISEPLLGLGAIAILMASQSGIQTSVIGFTVGLLLKDFRYESGLKAINNLFTLPIFGFLVLAANIGGGVASLNLTIFIAVVLRPIGKVIGISLGGAIGERLVGSAWNVRTWTLIGLLGGLGLTVSFLVANLSFSQPLDRLSAVLATLLASVVSLGLFAAVTSRRARRA